MSLSLESGPLDTAYSTLVPNLTQVGPWFMSHMKQHLAPTMPPMAHMHPFFVLYRTIRVKHRLNLILNPRYSHLAGSFTRHALQPCLYSTPASLLSTISFLSPPHIGLHHHL